MLEAITHRRWKLTQIVSVVAFVAVLVSSIPAASQIEAQGYNQTHVVQSGENLFRIALRYGMTVDQLAAANSITDPTHIYVGQVLTIPDGNTSAPAQANPSDNIVPPPSAPAQPSTIESPPATAPIYHIVERGQSLAAIGRQYGVSWQQLAEWNNITQPNTIFAGQRLVVNTQAAPDTAAVAGPTIVEAQPVDNQAAPSQDTTADSAPPAAPVDTAAPSRTHTVRPGERLASIAREYGISWTTIARANNIANPNTIFVGQTLAIPAQDDAIGTYLEPNNGVPSAPAPTTTTGKQILVELGSQRIFAYENGQLLKQVNVSTGLPGTPTVTGDYRVYWKLASQTMSGPGYYLPGVPYVMYFYQDYAIHGTYWHNNFGQPMSHGCVNLPTNDAQWFFNWADVGTPVHVTF